MKTEPSESHGRGRPLAFDLDEAIDAAMHVFWLKGYEGASLSDLTDAMGINKPSLYAKFGNKRDLFLAAIDHYIEKIGEPHTRPLVEGKTVRQSVEGYYASINSTLAAKDHPPGCLIGSVVTDLAGRDEEIREKAALLISSTEDYLTKRFRELGDAPMNERGLAQLVVSFAQSLATRARVGAGIDDLTRLTKRFLSMLFDRG